MSINFLALKNSNLAVFNATVINYSTLAGSTVIAYSSINTSTITTSTIRATVLTCSSIAAQLLTTSTITIGSTIVSLGQSTNQTAFGQTSGLYANTLWGSTLTQTYAPTTVKQVAASGNAAYQLVTTTASTANSVFLTQNSGSSWSVLGAATGLPAAATTNYSSGAVSATGQYGLLTTTGGYAYVTSNSGGSYANVNPLSLPKPHGSMCNRPRLSNYYSDSLPLVYSNLHGCSN